MNADDFRQAIQERNYALTVRVDEWLRTIKGKFINGQSTFPLDDFFKPWEFSGVVDILKRKGFEATVRDDRQNTFLTIKLTPKPVHTDTIDTREIDFYEGNRG